MDYLLVSLLHLFRTVPHRFSAHSPWCCLYLSQWNHEMCQRQVGAVRQEAAASLQLLEALHSSEAWCARKMRKMLPKALKMVKKEWLLHLTKAPVTTPLHPCCVLRGRGQGCTAPLPPGGSRERRLFSSTVSHKIALTSTWNLWSSNFSPFQPPNT